MIRKAYALTLASATLNIAMGWASSEKKRKSMIDGWDW